MPVITTHIATPEPWDDLQRALTGGGDGASCQCAWWTHTNPQFNGSSADQRRDWLQAEIDAGPPPGIIAYLDKQPAGWARIGPRTAQIRLARTRNIVAATTEPLDDPDVWAVTCFVVRREHRGSGLAAALLNAAVNYARNSGARLIEAYPTDTSSGKHSTNELFTGTLGTFVAAGFTQTGLRKPGRPIVALALAQGAN